MAFTFRASSLFFSSIRSRTCLFRRPISRYSVLLSELSRLRSACSFHRRTKMMRISTGMATSNANRTTAPILPIRSNELKYERKMLK